MPDFMAIRLQQMSAAADLYGRDAQATAASSGESIPWTPPSYAELVYNDWGDIYHEAALQAVDKEGDSIFTRGIVEEAQSRKLTLSDYDLETIGRHEDQGVAWRDLKTITFAMRTAYDSFHQSTRGNPAGVKCLNANSASKFWREGIGYFAATAGLLRVLREPESRWSRFRVEIEGYLEDVGDATGRVAANVLATGGRALGSGVSGFFGELGIVNSVIFLGAGYVAYKVL